MAAGRVVLPEYMPALDINGDPVPGARLYVWDNGTTDLASIYSDEALTTPLANPVEADVAGQFVTVWAEAGTTASPVKYSLAVTDSSGAAIHTPTAYHDFQPTADNDASVSAAAALASETAAEAAQAAAELAQSLAEDAEAQAAIYAAASNTAGFYASTAAGLAATSNGQYFSVITTATDGYLTYLNSAGSAVLQQTLPSVSYVTKHQQVIPCQITSSVNANNITIRPINTWTVLTGDLVSGTATNPRYTFTYKATADSIAGSYNVTILNGDGTAFLGSTALTDADGDAPGVGGIQANRMVEFNRRPSVFTLEWHKRSDTTTLPLANTISAYAESGKLPSPSRSVVTIKAGDNLTYVTVRLHEDNYDDPTYASQSDYARFVLFDQGDFQADALGEPVLNSVLSHVGCKTIHTANFIYKALDSGTTVETGLVPSTMEPVLILGDMDLAANTTNFVLSGPGHGDVNTEAWTLIVTRNDSSTGGVDTDSADLSAETVNYEYAGIKAVVTAPGKNTTTTGDICASYERILTFEPTADYQVKIDTTFDFNDAVGITPGTRVGGYATMAPMRDMNRCVAVVNGVQGAVTTIDLRDGSTQTFGYAERMIFWNADHPEVQYEVTNLIALASVPGATRYTHEADGVGVAFAQEVFIINNTYGAKCYWPIYPTTGKDSLASTILTFSSSYGVFRREPIV